LLGSDGEGLGIVIADLNQIADLKLSILAPVNSCHQPEPNTVLRNYWIIQIAKANLKMAIITCNLCTPFICTLLYT